MLLAKAPASQRRCHAPLTDLAPTFVAPRGGLRARSERDLRNHAIPLSQPL